ncbi:MAG: hypothetical protein ACXWVR_09220, partial [Rhodoplanes sp.]
MFKRYNPNYSLWPERARPGRRGIPLTLAAGGFAIGFVYATALYTVLRPFSAPQPCSSRPHSARSRIAPALRLK